MGRLELNYKDGMHLEFEITQNSPWTFFNGEIMKVIDFGTREQIVSRRLFLECGHCKQTYELFLPYKNICEICRKKKLKKYVCKQCFDSQVAFHQNMIDEAKLEQEENQKQQEREMLEEQQSS